MSFTVENVRSLARLARLSLGEGEIESLRRDLSEVVQYVEMLQKVNIDGVEAMTHAIPVDLSLRDDLEGVCVGRAGLLGSAGYEDGLVKVPKIIE